MIAVYFVDIPYMNGYDMRGVPLVQRASDPGRRFAGHGR